MTGPEPHVENVRWRPDDRRGLPHRLWTADDVDATEHEVTALVAALVRVTKPAMVIETGTYTAQTTLAIAEALAENDRGHPLGEPRGEIITFEVDPERYAAAVRRVNASIHADKISLVKGSFPAALATLPELFDRLSVGLAFLDSGMRTRQDDMDAVWPYMEAGGLVIIHDAAPDRPPGMVRPPCDPRDAIRLDLATPRGLVVWQKAWREAWKPYVV